MPVKKTNKSKTVLKPAKKVVLQKTSSPLVVSSAAKTPVKDNKNLKIFLGILVIVGLLYYFKGLFIAAMVNNQPVSRISIIQQLEKQYGKQTLDSEVKKDLILQEAKKENVKVSQDEINSEITKIDSQLKTQGQSLDQVLTLRGMSKNDLIEQITIQKLIEKMITGKVKVTDAEINDYIEKNKSSIPEGEDPNLIKQKAKDQLTQQKTNDEFTTWMENLQKKAKINYFINY